MLKVYHYINLFILTNYSWLQIHKDSSGHMLASTSLTEEGVEGVVSTTNGLVRGHLAIRLDAMLQAVQLPAGIAYLDTSLSNVDAYTLTLKHKRKIETFPCCNLLALESCQNAKYLPIDIIRLYVIIIYTFPNSIYDS